MEDGSVYSLSDAECSLAHAEVGEDVVEGFLGGDAASGDVGKGVEGEAEVFGKEVSAQAGMQAVKDALEAGVGTGEGLIVTGVGDNDVLRGEFGDVGCGVDGCLKGIDVGAMLCGNGKRRHTFGSEGGSRDIIRG